MAKDSKLKKVIAIIKDIHFGNEIEECYNIYYKEIYKELGFEDPEDYEGYLIDQAEKNYDVIFDKDSVLEALEKDGRRLQNFNQTIQEDYDCIRTALKQNYKIFDTLPERFKYLPQVIDIYYSGYIMDKQIEEIKERVSASGYLSRAFPDDLELNADLDLYLDVQNNNEVVRSKK